MKKLFLILSIVLLSATANATLRQARLDARFLTDRMAYELNLNANQFADVYEVNLDFIYKASSIMEQVVYGYNDAIQRYYTLLDQRNADLYYILSAEQYDVFINRDYFYRPIYSDYRGWYFRINHVYPNRSFYYYNAPINYFYSVGSHYGNGYYSNRNSGTRYNGEYRVMRHSNYDSYRRSDFGVNTRDRGQARPNNYDNRYNDNRTSDPRYQHRYNNENITVINDSHNSFHFGNGTGRSNGSRIGNGASSSNRRTYHFGNGRSNGSKGIGNGAAPTNTGIGNGAAPSNNNNGGIGSGAAPTNTGIGNGAAPSNNNGGIGTGATPNQNKGIGSAMYGN